MNKTLPLLYARGNNGKVLEWSIEVSGNKFRVTAGAQNAKHVTADWSVCKGKNVGRANSTSDESQALAEAEAKWEKKQKHGGYWLSIKDIDQSKFIEPMLAKNLKDRLNKIDWKSGVLVQNKFNGFRCVATFNGEDVILSSRKGEVYHAVVHINKDLQKFFEKYPDAVLDGELFNDSLKQKLNEISKLVRKTEHITADDLKRSEQLVQYFVYDGYDFDESTGQDVAYSIRKAWIDKNLPKFSKFYQAVKTETATSMSEVDSIFNKYVDDGQEGVIVRVATSPYENKRSAYLLKYKPLETDEATIMDINEGTGNWAGTGKVITLKWKGKTFDSTFKGTWEQAAQFLKEKKQWIGKEIQFQYNGLTGLNVPNYARVDIDNCTPEK